jgi:hypothetical protein
MRRVLKISRLSRFDVRQCRTLFGTVIFAHAMHRSARYKRRSTRRAPIRCQATVPLPATLPCAIGLDAIHLNLPITLLSMLIAIRVPNVTNMPMLHPGAPLAPMRNSVMSVAFLWGAPGVKLNLRCAPCLVVAGKLS